MLKIRAIAVVTLLCAGALTGTAATADEMPRQILKGQVGAILDHCEQPRLTSCLKLDTPMCQIQMTIALDKCFQPLPEVVSGAKFKAVTMEKCAIRTFDRLTNRQSSAKQCFAKMMK